MVHWRSESFSVWVIFIFFLSVSEVTCFCVLLAQMRKRSVNTLNMCHLKYYTKWIMVSFHTTNILVSLDLKRRKKSPHYTSETSFYNWMLPTTWKRWHSLTIIFIVNVYWYLSKVNLFTLLNKFLLCCPWFPLSWHLERTKIDKNLIPNFITRNAAISCHSWP